MGSNLKRETRIVARFTWKFVKLTTADFHAARRDGEKRKNPWIFREKIVLDLADLVADSFYIHHVIKIHIVDTCQPASATTRSAITTAAATTTATTAATAATTTTRMITTTTTTTTTRSNNILRKDPHLVQFHMLSFSDPAGPPRHLTRTNGCERRP
ncbi:hypothetical protein HZH66_004469 [Vespula vulgaris]|uniref:Uncharacterized protein n=1 Tax=Vespula vulgaris TaxID=7454 RepID=A0A834KF42_VESVU|nr:hypothetical protein HZH66_004469 [Vespula vulgaris]